MADKIVAVFDGVNGMPVYVWSHGVVVWRDANGDWGMERVVHPNEIYAQRQRECDGAIND